MARVTVVKENRCAVRVLRASILRKNRARPRVPLPSDPAGPSPIQSYFFPPVSV